MVTVVLTPFLLALLTAAIGVLSWIGLQLYTIKQALGHHRGHADVILGPETAPGSGVRKHHRGLVGRVERLEDVVGRAEDTGEHRAAVVTESDPPSDT